jgi:hypothetical protein
VCPIFMSMGIFPGGGYTDYSVYLHDTFLFPAHLFILKNKMSFYDLHAACDTTTLTLNCLDHSLWNVICFIVTSVPISVAYLIIKAFPSVFLCIRPVLPLYPSFNF